MKYKRFGWLLSVKSNNDLRLKAIVGLVFAVFIMRDMHYVKSILKKRAVTDVKNK